MTRAHTGTVVPHTATPRISKIHLIEDDPVLGRSLSISLETENFHVEWSQTLSDAREKIQARVPDLILLDVNLPDGSGFDFLRDLRLSNPSTPVIVLTARTDEDSVVEGLASGANDYVRKPFGTRELLARVSTALKAPVVSPLNVLKYGDLRVDLERRVVTFGERTVEMNRREFDILTYLVRHAEAVVTRDALLEAVNKGGEIYDRTIDSHISHLRARLRKAEVGGIQISSIYGVGYRLEKK
jgi:DNA-binding response OmpR family regulator